MPPPAQLWHQSWWRRREQKKSDSCSHGRSGRSGRSRSAGSAPARTRSAAGGWTTTRATPRIRTYAA
eukprot:10023066-Alexandrium_andersonii.AAC.1